MRLSIVIEELQKIEKEAGGSTEVVIMPESFPPQRISEFRIDSQGVLAEEGHEMNTGSTVWVKVSEL